MLWAVCPTLAEVVHMGRHGVHHLNTFPQHAEALAVAVRHHLLVGRQPIALLRVLNHRHLQDTAHLQLHVQPERTVYPRTPLV